MPVPRWDESDDQLFSELRGAVGERPAIADRMLEAAKVAYTWRTVDAELERLALSYDSSLDDVVLVRGATTTQRTLIFAGETFVVEVEVGPGVLMGQTVPASACRVMLLTARGEFGRAEADDAGFFLLAKPGAGPVRLQCQVAETRLLTDWVVL